MAWWRGRDPWRAIDFAAIERAARRPARILVTYADRQFLNAQRRCAETGVSAGGFDCALELRRRHLPRAWRRRHAAILAAQRGAGYWLWKPKLVAMTLARVPEGTVVFYCDSGARWIARIDPYVALLDASDVVAFTLGPDLDDLAWTRTDARVAAGVCEALAREPQRQAAFLLLRNAPASRAAVAAWLALCETGDLVTDAASRLPEAPEFRAHRHDQSLWSLVCKARGVPAVPDPSQWGNDRRLPRLPQILDLDRWRA